MATTVAVVGAGAFGGWTALHLLRAGAKVTLVDAWGPGNSRASSGDETRVIRGAYGPNGIYTEMVARSLPIWRENERRWRLKLLHTNGVLWMAGGGAGDSYERASIEHLRRLKLPFEEVPAAEAARRWPQIRWDGIAWAIHEKDAGFLLARRSCQAVLEGFVAENGAYRQAAVEPGAAKNGRMEPLRLSDGSTLAADAYVFACGPWLGKLFPDVLGSLITPTRQDLYYFGTPSGDPRFDDEHLPAWIDNSGSRFYGIPGNQWRGFKVAADVPGSPFDPTSGERVVAAAGVEAARAFLAARFPALRDAPVVESRVCQYEMSADGGLIVDRHPQCSNAWFAGGGSGHGFKFGPALGEQVARLVRGEGAVRPEFGLARFASGVPGRIGERK